MVVTLEQIAAALRRGPIILANGREVYELDAPQPTKGELATAKYPHVVRSAPIPWFLKK